MQSNNNYADLIKFLNEYMKVIDGKILFVSVFGSQAWKMGDKNSDIDAFVCYAKNGNRILIGEDWKNKFVEKYKDKYDISFYEVKNVLEGLKKSNINFITGVFSPIVIYENGNELQKLKQLGRNLISKEIYNSVHGLAVQNYKKYIESGKDNTEKRRNVIARMINFGIKLLENPKISIETAFQPANNISVEDIKSLIQKLDVAFNNSTLKSKPLEDEEELLDRYFLDLRKRFMWNIE